MTLPTITETPMQADRAKTIFEKSEPGRRAAQIPAALALTDLVIKNDQAAPAASCGTPGTADAQSGSGQPGGLLPISPPSLPGGLPLLPPLPPLPSLPPLPHS